jgi:hypothetical protein
MATVGSAATQIEAYFPLAVPALGVQMGGCPIDQRRPQSRQPLEPCPISLAEPDCSSRYATENLPRH